MVHGASRQIGRQRGQAGRQLHLSLGLKNRMASIVQETSDYRAGECGNQLGTRLETIVAQ